MKKVMSHLLMSSVIFFALPVVAQKSHSPGYIVTLIGDTIHGEIKYKAWDKNPRSILMTSDEGTTETAYDPTNIRAFFVAGEHYESAVVDVDTSGIRIHELNENAQPELKRDTVFLQSLFRGKKALLYLKDASAKEHFYIDDNGLKPLVYKKYLRFFESQGLIRKLTDENADYKRQLFFYLENCPEIQKKIEGSRYEASSLTNLFAKYHECIDQRVDYENKREFFEVETGLIAGITQTQLYFHGHPQVFSYLIDIAHGKSSTPSFGIFFNARLLRSRGIKLSNDLIYSTFDIHGEGVDYQGTSVESNFSYGLLKMHNLVQMNMVNSGLLFIDAGISSAVFTKRSYQIKVAYAPGAEANKDFESRDYEFGVVAGVGLNWSRITLDLRYERSNGISSYSNLGAKGRRLHLFLKYKLWESQ